MRFQVFRGFFFFFKILFIYVCVSEDRNVAANIGPRTPVPTGLNIQDCYICSPPMH